MAVQDLKEQIVRLPEQPGVYVWSSAAGEVLYVGKARSLRDRVRSYLGAHGLSPRHDALLNEIGRLEVIVTDSVMEALALENNLIKQRTPKETLSGKHPERLIVKAVERMLKKESPLARRQMRNLKVYPGPDHPHVAQNPEAIDLAKLNPKNKRSA